MSKSNQHRNGEVSLGGDKDPPNTKDLDHKNIYPWDKETEKIEGFFGMSDNEILRISTHLFSLDTHIDIQGQAENSVHLISLNELPGIRVVHTKNKIDMILTVDPLRWIAKEARLTSL